MSVAAPLAAVVSWLAAETGDSFIGSIGGRLFHRHAKESEALPLCVYGVAVSAQPSRYFDGSDRERYVLQFDVWVDTQAPAPDTTCMDIDAKLYARLNEAILSATGFDRITCLCIVRGEPDIGEDGWRCSSQYEIKGVRTP